MGRLHLRDNNEDRNLGIHHLHRIGCRTGTYPRTFVKGTNASDKEICTEDALSLFWTFPSTCMSDLRDTSEYTVFDDKKYKMRSATKIIIYLCV